MPDSAMMLGPELCLGHAAYVDEDYAGALSHYSRAIASNPEDAAAFSARAAAHIQLKHYTEAVSDATLAVKIGATPKAYQRKGQARRVKAPTF